MRVRRVSAELPVDQRPRELQWALECERAIGEPEVQVEAEWRPLERLERAQVERDRVRDDLVEELLAKLDRAFP